MTFSGFILITITILLVFVKGEKYVS